MRIGLIAPVYERVPPLLHGGTERTVALLAGGLQARGHNVSVFASADSTLHAPVLGPVQHAEGSIDPTTATLLHIADAYERTSEFDMIHNHAGPLAFPFAPARMYEQVDVRLLGDRPRPEVTAPLSIRELHDDRRVTANGAGPIAGPRA